MDLQVKLARVDQMAPQDCLDFPDNPDLEDNQEWLVQLVQWAQRVCQVYEDQQEREVLVESLVIQEKQAPQVYLAQLGQRGRVDQLEKKDSQANLAYLDAMVRINFSSIMRSVTL